MNTIELRLDMNEVSTIIKALSERPFKEVCQLLNKIHTQSQTQINQLLETPHNPQ